MISISNNSEYLDLIKQREKVVVEFFEEEDSSCQSIGPEYNQLAEDHPGITFVRVNASLNSVSKSFEKILVVPTFIFYSNGAEFTRFSGANTEELRKDLIRLI